ncbi:hypothetical protein, partial [Bifidobacterium longum]|uniref:hypothetical protein n=1 Tax=Bifidobacterium longum TaxID=216816 RepID=UPI0032BF71A8
EIVPGRRTMSLNSSLNQNAQQTGRYLQYDMTAGKKLSQQHKVLRREVNRQATPQNWLSA